MVCEAFSRVTSMPLLLLLENCKSHSRGAMVRLPATGKYEKKAPTALGMQQ
jgi:hypothetical protein